MAKAALLAWLMTGLLVVSAFGSSDHKIAVHVLPHSNTNCNGLPRIYGCKDIQYTYDGCDDVDVFPVVYDVGGITGIDVGLSWPASWGSCAFTPCGFDLMIHDIVHPGDWVTGTWVECQSMTTAVVGFGWLAPNSGGEICPSPNTMGFMGVTDCDYTQYEASATFCAGVCGTDGEDPCGGGVSEAKTWGSIKSMYR